MKRFFKRIAGNKLSAIIQVLILLLLLAIIFITFYKIAMPPYCKWAFFFAALALILLQCCRLKNPMLLIDRIFAHHAGKQIALAFLVFVITFDFAMCLFPNYGLRRTFIDFISPMVLFDEATDSYHIDFDSTAYISNYDKIAYIEDPAIYRSRADYLKHGFVYLLGILVFNGLLIATVNRVMATRSERYKKGTNTYKNITDHYIIIGYGPSCPALIRNLASRLKKSSAINFILLTNQDPEAIRRILRSQFQDVDEMVAIYSGDMDSYSHLRRLNIEKAREVFVLGEGCEAGRDSKNLECAKKTKEIRERSNASNMFHINIQFDKPSSYSTIKRITIPKKYYLNDNDQPIVYLHPFNFYENWSRLLWGYHQIDGYMTLDRSQMVETGPDARPMPANKHVHLVIAGFDEMGVAALLEALRVCHYPNYVEATGENKTRITVVDPKMNELLPRFKSQYPNLNQIRDIEIEFKNCSLEDETFRNELGVLSTQKDTVLTVAICFADADASLSAALSLPDLLFYDIADGKIIPNNNTQILVRQEIKSGLTHLLDEENGKYANIKVFGTLDKGIDDTLLDDKMAIIISAYYHFKYDLSPSKDFFTEIESDKEGAITEAARNWITLNEDKRFANRYQTEIYRSFLSYRTLLEQNPELLYQTEHMRWCAERSITGYRDLHEANIKSDTYQIHKLIVPYSELSEHEKGKDKDVLLIMDKVIALSESLHERIL